jgi:hypothetical protein
MRLDRVADVNDAGIIPRRRQLNGARHDAIVATHDIHEHVAIDVE